MACMEGEKNGFVFTNMALKIQVVSYLDFRQHFLKLQNTIFFSCIVEVVTLKACFCVLSTVRTREFRRVSYCYIVLN